jgi:hypothetical protein
MKTLLSALAVPGTIGSYLSCCALENGRRRIARRRNVIERMFCKLKNWRRIATRYDRHAQNYLSALALAAIMCQWI